MRRRARCLLFFLGLVLAPARSPGQDPPLGGEFQVNSYTTSAQSVPAIASAGDGTFVVVWRSTGQDGSGDGIFGQRFGDLGEKLGSEFPVNTYTTSRQKAPSVGVDAEGNFAVAWDGYRTGSSYDVWGQRFDDTASPIKIGPEFEANTATAEEQTLPSVAMRPSGDFVVVWQSTLLPASIRGQRFDASGAKVGGEFQANNYTGGFKQYPAASMDEAGDFVVVWMGGGEESGEMFDTGIFGRRFDRAGSPVGPELHVNTTTTSSQNHPAVAMGRRGDFVAVWDSYHEGSSDGIFGQRFNASGEKVGPEFPVNSYTTGRQTAPSVAIDRRGNFLVVWMSQAQDGSSFGVFGQRFDRAGERIGSEFPINAYTTDDQKAPSVVHDGRGFVVVWGGDVEDGSNYGVFGRRESLQATGLLGDDHGVGTSDLNGVIEPGEAVRIEPSWKNASTGAMDLTGTVSAAGFGGPPGPIYTLLDSSANYGTVAPGAAAGCDDGNAAPCYAVQISGARPATHWDAFLEENLSSGGGKHWILHLGDSFADVPRSQPFYRKIETLLHNGVTSGCNATQYCPSVVVSRGQMAIFIAKSLAGSGELVPTAGVLNGQSYNCSSGGVSRFTDVSRTDSFCRHVHYLGAQNVTLGCSATAYCPDQPVTRDAMASFIAKAVVAPGGGNAVPLIYGPDPATGRSYSCSAGSPNRHFTDVSVSNPFCKHIHYLWARGFVDGCSATTYCPTQSVNRDAMAKFLANAFDLMLYGP